MSNSLSFLVEEGRRGEKEGMEGYSVEEEKKRKRH